jgi:hypothetical protein
VCGFGVQQLLHMNNSRIKKATAAAAKKKSRWCQNIFFSSHMKGVHLITSNVRIGRSAHSHRRRRLKMISVYQYRRRIYSFSCLVFFCFRYQTKNQWRHHSTRERAHR